MLVDNIQIEKEISNTTVKVFKELQYRALELDKLGEPNPSEKLVLKCQEAVNAEIRIELLWVPSKEPDLQQDVVPSEGVG